MSVKKVTDSNAVFPSIVHVLLGNPPGATLWAHDPALGATHNEDGVLVGVYELKEVKCTRIERTLVPLK